MLLLTAADVVPPVIQAIERENPAEIYLYLVQILQPEFHFKHAESFVAAIQSHQENGFEKLVKSTNPILTMVVIFEILIKLKSQYRSLSLRISSLLDDTEEHFVTTFENYSKHEKLEILLQQKDLRGKTTLEYLSELNLHRFLQINHVNRIVSRIWESKTDISGSIFDMATSYDLCFKNKMRYMEDHEKHNRFYESRDHLIGAKPHALSFVVW